MTLADSGETVNITESSQRRQKRARVRRGKVSSRGQTNTRLSCSARWVEVRSGRHFLDFNVFRGNPPPTLYWTMDGKIVRNSHETRIITKKFV